MADINDIQLRMDLIKMSREMLNEEYINKRAEDHNAWLAASELAWTVHRVKLPYPPFTKYPTNEDIISKADAMYNFINPAGIGSTTSTPTPIVEQVEVPIEQLTPIVEQVEVPIEQPIPITIQQDTPPEKSSSLHNLLPGWVRRTNTG